MFVFIFDLCSILGLSLLNLYTRAKALNESGESQSGILYSSKDENWLFILSSCSVKVLISQLISPPSLNIALFPAIFIKLVAHSELPVNSEL